jgi:hypothetical protein
MYDGRFMIEHAIDQFRTRVDKIRVVIQQAHDEQYNVRHTLEHIYGTQVIVTMLPEVSVGPAMSAVSAMPKTDTPVFIKDCDNFFDFDLVAGNTICVIDSAPDLARSYVNVVDDKVVAIEEKSVISNLACAGGYGFASSNAFVRAAWDAVAHKVGEVFISHVIHELIKTQDFAVEQVHDYVDLGVHDKFIEFNRQHKTVFCDIDGVVVKNQAEFFKPFYTEEAVPIKPNCNKLLAMQAEGAQFVFTTSRKEKFRKVTAKTLDDIGFTNYQLLMGLNHSQRLLINDYAASNPFPSAMAISIPRDSAL